MVFNHRFIPLHLRDFHFSKHHFELAIFALGLMCSVTNTLGSAFYTRKMFNAGSACFNLGCTTSAMIGIRDLHKLKADKTRWAKVETVDVWAMVLGISANLFFSIGVILYYPAVSAHTGSVGYWVSGFLFVIGCWFFNMGLSMSSGRTHIVDPTGEVLGLPTHMAMAAPHIISMLFLVRTQLSHFALLFFVMGSILFLPVTAQPQTEHQLGSWMFVVGGAVSVADSAWSLALGCVHCIAHRALYVSHQTIVAMEKTLHRAERPG